MIKHQPTIIMLFTLVSMLYYNATMSALLNGWSNYNNDHVRDHDDNNNNDNFLN